MALATATATIANFPNGADNTQRRQLAFGLTAIGASALTYTAGGIRINFTPLSSIKVQPVNLLPLWADFKTESGSGYVYVFNPLGPAITNVALTANVVTITAANNLVSGDVVIPNSVVTATFLNGVKLTVATASASSFTAALVHGNYVSASDSGFAPPFSYASGLPFQGNLMVFQSAGSAAPLAQISTAAVPAGVSGDTIGFRAEFLRV